MNVGVLFDGQDIEKLKSMPSSALRSALSGGGDQPRMPASLTTQKLTT